MPVVDIAVEGRFIASVPVAIPRRWGEDWRCADVALKAAINDGKLLANSRRHAEARVRQDGAVFAVEAFGKEAWAVREVRSDGASYSISEHPTEAEANAWLFAYLGFSRHDWGG